MTIAIANSAATAGVERADDAAEDDRPYFVVPLSMQPDGDDYLIGNAELEDYYQIPAAGHAIIRALQQGRTPAEIKAALRADAAEAPVDVDDFVAMLREIGFAYPADGLRTDGARAHAERVGAAPADRRILFRADPRLARALFSPLALGLYAVVVGWAAWLAASDPALRIDRHAFYIERDFTLTLLALLLLSSVAVSLHELGHMLAAARHGVASRLGIGNRLWNIVAEADLSGILALPKRQRYLPLLAGLLVDVLVIASCTLLLARLLDAGAGGFGVQLLKALVLQIVVTMVWQLNFFLKTDVYYVVSTWFSYPDLDADARRHLGGLLHRLSGGRRGAPADASSFRNARAVRLFTLFWLAGRMAAVGVLVLVFIPTILLYVERTWDAFRDPAASTAAVIDLGVFALLSAAILAGGLWMWARGRRLPRGS